MNNKINAGEFSVWLNEFIQTMKGNGNGNVPCGNCVGCCTSFKFIHIRPTDVATIENIPKEIIFKAPGLPKGHYLMGYDEKGHCPMFKEGKCSIYNFRPETCKQYDCRVLTASGILINDESLDITNKVHSWSFEYSSKESKKLSEAVKLAGKFLCEYSAKFPEGFKPLLNSQLSALAVRVHAEFIGHTVESARVNCESIIEKLITKYSY